MTEIIKPIEKEMKDSYVDYAMSVIVGRALPDVRDGLKPVHKRILYAMYLLGNFHNKPFKKSARIVGECLGRLHPHGDTAVYDSLVRMAQDFSMRYTLVDGQGNFGSVDGDRAAAMRYSEARLSRTAEEMLKDIEKDTVNWAPNFDGTLQEPLVLPSRVPNLIVNGSSGIAVGMATNMLPHNLGETIDALILLINNPTATLEDILQVLPGPDLPTGGVIMGRMGIRSAFATGRGSITVRAKTEIEEDKKGAKIKITEFPYMTNKANTIFKIAELVKNKKLEGVRDIKDLSDRKGLLVVIDVDKGFDPNVVLNNLFKQTDLERHFGVINLALVNRVPRELNMKQLLSKFIDFRVEVVTRRTKFDQNKAEERKHIVEGLLVAVNNIDETVKLVKGAEDPADAAKQLIFKFDISEKQSKAILDMKLQRLTGLERGKLEKEMKDLEEKIAEYKKILGDETVLMNVIKSELTEIKDKYRDERRTEISDEVCEEIDNDELVNDEAVVVMLTRKGYVKRVSLEEYHSQGRGGKGVIGIRADEDMVKDIIAAKNRDWLLVFTDDGKVYWIKAYRIPQMGRYAQGRHIKNLLQIGDSKVCAIIPVREWEGYLITVTEKGIVKRTALSAYSRPRSNGIIALTLKNDDRVMNVKKTSGKDDIVIITMNGMAIRFDENDARELGRTAQGVIGIRLRKDDKVVAACVAKDQILTITELGYGKRTAIENYRKQHRGGKGVIDIKTVKGKVAAAHNVTDDCELILLSARGMVVRIPVNSIRMVGRNTVGVRLMRLREKDTLIASAIINERINSNGCSSGEDKSAETLEELRPKNDVKSEKSSEEKTLEGEE